MKTVDKPFDANAGKLWLEIPLSARLMDLAYEDLLAIVQDDAKCGAESALHEAMHYRSGFECAGYKVICQSTGCTQIAERDGLCKECREKKNG